MIYESKSGYIFDICQFCQKELSEMEKVFCDVETAKTEIPYKICHNCLDKKFGGKYPAVS